MIIDETGYLDSHCLSVITPIPLRGFEDNDIREQIIALLMGWA